MSGQLTDYKQQHLEHKEKCDLFLNKYEQADVVSTEHAVELLRRSSRQRRKGTTALNRSSSRSHSVFTVTVHWAEEAQTLPRRRTAISFVDLAGTVADSIKKIHASYCNYQALHMYLCMLIQVASE